ncbi:hypothetical protein Tco_0379410 [Tanacetum coccineum]
MKLRKSRSMENSVLRETVADREPRLQKPYVIIRQVITSSLNFHIPFLWQVIPHQPCCPQLFKPFAPSSLLGWYKFSVVIVSVSKIAPPLFSLGSYASTLTAAWLVGVGASSGPACVSAWGIHQDMVSSSMEFEIIKCPQGTGPNTIGPLKSQGLCGRGRWSGAGKVRQVSVSTASWASSIVLNQQASPAAAMASMGGVKGLWQWNLEIDSNFQLRAQDYAKLYAPEFPEKKISLRREMVLKKSKGSPGGYPIGPHTRKI